MKSLKEKKGFICDMDGVIYHGNKLLDGVKEFVEWLSQNNKSYLFLTNSSERSPRELSQKLERLGLSVSEDHFYTSAMATASFLHSQNPNGSAFVIGEAGLINAIYGAGFSMNDVDPDYVVVGETSSYSYNKIEKAIRLVLKGAKLIGTNPDVTGPTEKGIAPATKALIAPIELSTEKHAYFVGKPNPLMMRHAIKHLGVSREDAAIIGDRMDTDIIAGIESEIDTVLVLSGISTRETIEDYPYRPDYVFDNVGDIIK
ncbi:MAG: HAD family hydrolase [Clostridia bacterium]|nr:HAD family hydrolase [Clostridia bacterium]